MIPEITHDTGAALPDEADFTRLYQETYPNIARYLLRRGAGDEVADLAAETFIVAWRRRAQWQRLPAEKRMAWLYGVARKLLANARRSAERRPAYGALGEASAQQPDHSDLTLEQLAVADALARLTSDDAELIRLCAWEGLSPAQAAEVLGCRPGTATMRLHRARKRLRKLLETTVPEGRPTR